MALRLKTQKTIDSEHEKLIDAEKRHWENVLERLIIIVRYLAGQSLAFRGNSDNLYNNNNGNFLQLIEAISKFDEVLSEHLLRIKND